MRQFWLQRDLDVSGTSGTGVVAEGVEYWNGRCAMCWYGTISSIAIYESLEQLEKIHGHQGATRIIFYKPVDMQSQAV